MTSPDSAAVPADAADSARVADAPLLQLREISVSFKDLTVVKDVSLEVQRGEVVALIGPSGAGKSTLLRSINRLEQPSAGEMTFNAQNVGNDRRSLDRLRREVGMVFQQFNLFPHLTAVENVMLAQVHTLNRSKKDARERAVKELKHVGLEQHADKKPAQCSGGQQQRIAIARALAMDPQVMLFDEPTASLDPELSVEVLNTMRRLASEGMTMIVCTHEMQFAEEVADRVVFMADGRIIDDGPPSNILRKPEHPRIRQFLSAYGNR